MIKESLKTIALSDDKLLKNFKHESAMSFQREKSCQECQALKRC